LNRRKRTQSPQRPELLIAPGFFPHLVRPETLAGRFGKAAQNHQKRQPTLNDPAKF
jgi:hypothetical protein